MKNFIWLMVGLLLASDGWAGPALSWTDCLREAQAQHPGLLAARQAVNAAQASVRAAQAARLPQLSASGQAGYAENSEATGGEDSYRASVDVDQVLYDGGSTRSAVQLAEADAAAALAEARQSEADILYNLRVAYADLLWAQEQIGLLEQIRQRRADNVEMVELRYQGGQEHQGSLALNQAALKEAETDLLQARRNLEITRGTLGRALGRERDDPELTLSGSLDDVPMPGVVDRAAIARITPASVQAEVARARARFSLQQARSGRQPTLSAYGTASRYGDEWSVEEDSVGAGVRLSIPLWAGGQTGADIRRAGARLAAAEASLADTRNSQRTRVDQSLQSFQEAVEALAVRRQFLEAQELRATIAREQYGNGLLKFDNWDIIENDLINRQKSLLETRRQAWRAEAAWWQVTGRGLAEGEAK
jgi:outer membrane protein